MEFFFYYCLNVASVNCFSLLFFTVKQIQFDLLQTEYFGNLFSVKNGRDGINGKTVACFVSSAVEL